MRDRRLVRMLVAYSKTFYFIDKGTQRGSTYELGMLLEKALNAGTKDRARPIRVVFIPTSRDQLLPALAAGRGDIAAANLTITPERLELVDFSAPIAGDVSEILVTPAGTTAPASAEGLSGAKVHVRRSSSYYSSLVRLNTRLKALGKAPVEIVPADENLEDEDILEMVNAGLIPATIVDSHIATFWKQIFETIELHPDVRVREGGEVAWAIRKDSPQFKQVVDAFIAKNRKGSATGNDILNRYLKSTKWVKNATADADMKRLREVTDLFKKYSDQYGFDWLLVAAQGYQESGLDQSTRSRVGAIGVMQVMPATARDRNVNIPNIHELEPNIHAGVKYLRFMVNEYFDEPGIDRVNRHLFAFASYNAGPNRIQRLRRVAADEGLDPNKWFNNVEVVVAREVGRETVQYVSNIYKYYLAYKLVVEKTREREAAKKSA
ncbi:MAG TPA: transporter substrate-binding domain-containing protein [Steroidobacteraceae bacterium]|nr:transporter substrate-binding domain-containing protein [Steroidobacteraceae bacterium]